MTLAEACAVFNQKKHGGRDNWTTTGTSGLISRDKFGPTLLPSAFEAIAIAEKYERADAAAPTPAERAEPYLMPGRNVRRW